MIEGSNDSELKSLLLVQHSTPGYWTDGAGILSWRRHHVRHYLLSAALSLSTFPHEIAVHRNYPGSWIV